MQAPMVPQAVPVAAPPRRWDRVVRLTHWGVAAAAVANELVTKAGSFFHVWIGYAAGTLLALRLAWGVFGSPEARFGAFPPSPRRALAHVRDIAAGRHPHHRSHNPLGAFMAYAIWSSLAVVVVTGVVLVGPPPMSLPAASGQDRPVTAALRQGELPEIAEPVALKVTAERPKTFEDLVGEVHTTMADILFVLAALHLAGVAFETRRSGAHIVRAMFGGPRRTT